VDTLCDGSNERFYPADLVIRGLYFITKAGKNRRRFILNSKKLIAQHFGYSHRVAFSLCANGRGGLWHAAEVLHMGTTNAIDIIALETTNLRATQQLDTP
jgi:hypothetical protein